MMDKINKDILLNWWIDEGDAFPTRLVDLEDGTVELRYGSMTTYSFKPGEVFVIDSKTMVN